MLQTMLAFLVAAGLALPYAAETWPLDTAVVGALERTLLVEGQKVSAHDLARSVASEQRSMLASDMVFVGTWELDEDYVVGPDGARYHAAWVSTELCLKGDCADSVRLHRHADLVIFANARLGTRQPDWSVPKVGKRYLFVAWADSDDPAFLYGGFGHRRYELADGIVVSKGVTESEFVAVVESLLDAAAGHAARRVICCTQFSEHMHCVDAPVGRRPMRKRCEPRETSLTDSCVASTARPGRRGVGWVTTERLLHALFGNNIVIGRHVLRQLDCLKEVLPPDFRGRRVDDLGCGDGKLTVLLREILQPVGLRGFDVNPALVRRARSKGIEARVVDLEDRVPVGELAVLWGVLHHLGDPTRCLARVRVNYECAFIREPIHGTSSGCLELGSPLRRHHLDDMVRRSLPGSDVFFYDDCVFAFWDSRNQVATEPPVLGCRSVASVSRE